MVLVVTDGRATLWEDVLVGCQYNLLFDVTVFILSSGIIVFSHSPRCSVSKLPLKNNSYLYTHNNLYL